ncbi:MAG: glycosyltransferase, partial [Gemmatimonadetes bacterium]|nr:glycosyltransferase family 4 protein [Gemmatimonadota bacterium]NIR77044.1 glycosyltransferase family 4 protein [Gemmatimonadota bacterium]NIT88489.1 glycosyltransferase family 4 protein [Gemmatimonadota bacterium]NIU32312.1 glycosyltransferase family 4 protein [Gemmatimonadota bacterium]NIU34459.1 glycosyltransferase [Gemmatimonadota bacterium]
LLERPVPRVYRDVPTVAVSESTAEDLVRRGMPPERITVIPNGIDLESFRPDPDDRPFDEPTLLYLGRLKRYKRVDLILRAVGLLRDEGRRVRLLVAGRGDREEALRALAGRLGLGDRVRFLGFVSEERKRRLLRRAWIHLLTSTKEGWGITNLEAAACGTPTVASDTPGLRDSVRHGETGLLVPHGDVQALAKAVARLLDDGRERRRMGEEARRFAEGFSWEGSTRRMEEFLRARVAAAPALP